MYKQLQADTDTKVDTMGENRLVLNKYTSYMLLKSIYYREKD